MKMLKIIKGEKFDEIKQALKQTNGRCPCVVKYLWNEDTKCMCKQFREQEYSGNCHCMMYKKVEVE